MSQVNLQRGRYVFVEEQVRKIFVAIGKGDYQTVLAKTNTKMANITDDRGRSMVSMAVFEGHFNITYFLLSLGADPNLQDKVGNSALDMTLYRDGYLDIAKLIKKRKDGS